MSFDRLAPHYRWMEFVLAGDKLQRCRIRFLNQIRSAKNILIVGEGNGRFLLECRKQTPGAHITCIDASERMLAAAKYRLHQNNQKLDHIGFICADALTLDFSGKQPYDAIVTHFFLDCFPENQLNRLVEKLTDAAAPKAIWLLADFQCPGAGILKLRARLILWSMYFFFQRATKLSARTLIPPGPILERHGFQLRERVESEWGLLHSDCWDRLN